MSTNRRHAQLSVFLYEKHSRTVSTVLGRMRIVYFRIAVCLSLRGPPTALSSEFFLIGWWNDGLMRILLSVPWCGVIHLPRTCKPLPINMAIVHTYTDVAEKPVLASRLT